MTQDVQKISESRSVKELDGRDSFKNREQLISGFNDLPSNHSFDISLLMKRDGQISFAPLADDQLASSVMNDNIFQPAKPGTPSESESHNPKYEKLNVQALLNKMSDHTSSSSNNHCSGDSERDQRGHGDGHGHSGREHSGDRHSGHKGHGGDHGDNGNSLPDVQQLINDMDALDGALSTNFASAQDGGSAALTSALGLQEQMLKDPNIMQHAKLDSAMLNMNKQLASLLGRLPGGEQLMAQIMQTEQQALSNIGCGGVNSPPQVEPPSPSDQPPSFVPPSDQPPSFVPPADQPPSLVPPSDQPPTPSPTPEPNPSSGTDLSSIFQKGDSGVTAAEYQHAIDIANALPEDMKQTLASNGVNLSVMSGFNGGAQGQNNGTYGEFYADSGMADQAEVHELYEMYGQLSNGGPGSWSDSKAVSLADKGMQAAGDSVYYEGDLNDTVGALQGDGDHMSNAFTADFFATHPGLNQDSYGQDTLSLTAQDDPNLVAYIAQAQGLVSASA